MRKPARKDVYYWVIYCGMDYIARYQFCEPVADSNWTIPGHDDLFSDKEFDDIGKFVANLKQ